MLSKEDKKWPLLLCAVTHSVAWAQSSHHAGNGLAFQWSSSKLNDPLVSGADGYGASSRSHSGSVRFDHLQPLNDNWLVGFVADFNLSEQKATRGSGKPTEIELGYPLLGYVYYPGGVSTTQLKRKLSLHAQVGYAFNPSQMVLGRVGFHRSSVKVTGGGQGSFGGWCLSAIEGCQLVVDMLGVASSSGARPGQANLSGYSMAFGYRHNLSKNTFVQIEAQKVFYNRSAALNIKPSVLDLGAGLGFRF